jgi:hypothetical protein
MLSSKHLQFASCYVYVILYSYTVNAAILFDNHTTHFNHKGSSYAVRNQYSQKYATEYYKTDRQHTPISDNILKKNKPK